MARSFNGSTQYGSVGSAIVTAAPLTLAAWVSPTTVTGNYALVSIGHNAAGDQRFVLGLLSSNIICQAVLNGSGGLATSAATVLTNTWQHAAAVFASSTSRAAYRNGTAKGTNATNITPGTPTITTVGAQFVGSATASFFYSGLIAEAGIWNAALSDQEIAALALGVPPFRVRPAALVGYWPLWGFGSPEPDLSGSANNLTLTATPPAANHAPVTLFTKKSPALTYPSYLPPANYGIAPIGQNTLLHGGRL